MQSDTSPISDAPPLVVPRTLRSVVEALFRALRPHQAVKNLFVFAALIFTGNLFDGPKLLRVTAAFFLFSLAAGSIYILNDLLDVEADRHHPKNANGPSRRALFRWGWPASRLSFSW